MTDPYLDRVSATAYSFYLRQRLITQHLTVNFALCIERTYELEPVRYPAKMWTARTINYR